MVIFKRIKNILSLSDKYIPMFITETFIFSFAGIEKNPADMSLEELLKHMKNICPKEVKWDD